MPLFINKQETVRIGDRVTRRKLEIKTGVRKDLYGDRWCRSGDYLNLLYKWLDNNKEDVIDRTAALLTDKLLRTKAVKAMVAAVGEEVKDDGSV